MVEVFGVTVTGRELRLLAAFLVLLVGLAAGIAVRRAVRAALGRAGVPDAVEGTAFDRAARRVGSSTAGVFSELAAWFVFIGALLLALQVARVAPVEAVWVGVTAFLPNLFLAVLALVVGFVVGEKAELTAREYLRGVKLPEVSVLPKLIKWSVFYVAVLVALSQIGVATGALLLLFGIYAAAVLLFAALALRDLLRAGAAGVYVLLHQPYSIGDTIAVGDREGVVQEVDVFVTRIENGERQYVVPNHLVLRDGVSRVLD